MIIKSLLDVDFYKYLMAQVAFDMFPDAQVSYYFKNRNKNLILKNIINEDRLKAEIEAVKSLKLSNEQAKYLRSLNQLSETFIDYLSRIKLSDVNVDYSGDEIQITTKGTWAESILWETIILAIVNELYTESLDNDKDKLLLDAKSILYNKIAKLIKRPDIKFSDFGTRRRYSADWQRFVVTKLKSELGNSLMGTSNVQLAMDLGLTPIGTQAHELYMIGSGIFDMGTDESLRGSHSKMLEIWQKTHGLEKTIALSDTYGSDFFLKDFKKFAAVWKGVRHDSGDPFEFGRKVVKYYKDLRIDPMTKVIVFSDGLDVDLMIRLQDEFGSQINVVFGIGTNLTNDMCEGWKPLSIVMKAQYVFKDGKTFELVKLSDNPGKISGSESVVKRYKRVFNYNDKTIELTETMNDIILKEFPKYRKIWVQRSKSGVCITLFEENNYVMCFGKTNDYSPSNIVKIIKEGLA